MKENGKLEIGREQSGELLQWAKREKCGKEQEEKKEEEKQDCGGERAKEL